jgi:hypothetical protein
VARPLLDIHCITDEYCDYPVAVRIAMDDGTIQTYTLDAKEDYQFKKVMDSLKKMTVGYEYKPRRKNRIRNCRYGHGK